MRLNNDCVRDILLSIEKYAILTNPFDIVKSTMILKDFKHTLTMKSSTILSNVTSQV